MLKIYSRCATTLKLSQISTFGRWYSNVYNKSGPPSILFFGSDSFSVVSLSKLHETQKYEGNFYRSLEVVTREPAPSGRGLKIRKKPLQIYAEERNIAFHTVSKESLPNFTPKLDDVDLLIAVSFGLFIPPRIIGAVKDTINVHPSLLPQYRGPAPIHHAILNGDRHTGVSLQTLSPVGFDKGVIFDQSFPILIEDDEQFPALWDRLALIAADMLVSALKNETYKNAKAFKTFTTESYAGFVHKQIDWNATSADKAIRLSRIHDPITGAISLDDGRRVDILVQGISRRQQGSGGKPPGTYFIARHAPSGDKKMVVVCDNRETVWVEKVKVSGRNWISGLDFAGTGSERFWGGKFVPWRREFDDHDPKEFE